MTLENVLLDAAGDAAAFVFGWAASRAWLRFRLVERMRPRCTWCSRRVVRGVKVCGACKTTAREDPAAPAGWPVEEDA